MFVIYLVRCFLNHKVQCTFNDGKEEKKTKMLTQLHHGHTGSINMFFIKKKKKKNFAQTTSALNFAHF